MTRQPRRWHLGLPAHRSAAGGTGSVTCASHRWRQQHISGGSSTAAGGKSVAARRPRRRGGRRLTLEAELGLVAVALDALLAVLAGGAAPDAGTVGGEAPAVHALLTGVARLGALQAARHGVVGVLLLLHADSAGRSCRRGAGEGRRRAGWSVPPATAAADRRPTGRCLPRAAPCAGTPPMIGGGPHLR